MSGRSGSLTWIRVVGDPFGNLTGSKLVRVVAAGWSGADRGLRSAVWKAQNDGSSRRIV